MNNTLITTAAQKHALKVADAMDRSADALEDAGLLDGAAKIRAAAQAKRDSV